MKKLLVILMTMSLVMVFITPVSIAKDFSEKILEEIRESVMMVRGPSGWGSGVVISERQMVTAYHVVDNKSGLEEMTLIRIINRHGKEWKAEILATDQANDLALLVLIDKGETFPSKPVEFARKYKLGDPVFSAGYNLQGFEEYGGERCPDEDKTTVPVTRIGFGHISDIRSKLIYIDIGCYSWGSSGGGTFTKKGKLIGINSMILADGAGKIGIIRPIKAATFYATGLIPPTSKKKLTDYIYKEKHRAFIQHIMHASGPPAYKYWRSNVWVKRIFFSEGFITEEENGKEKHKIWLDANMPDKHWVEFHYGPAVGLVISEVLIWIQEDEGYEKMTFNYIVAPGFNIIRDDEGNYKETEWIGMVIYRATKGYIVCSDDNVILNMHGGSWTKDIDKEASLPDARKWFSLAWKRWIEPHYKGE